MKHNTNDHLNAVYFALLNLADDGTYSISHVEINGPDKFIHIEKHLRPTFCPSCNARMHSKGIYTRRVNHPIIKDTDNLTIKTRKTQRKRDVFPVVYKTTVLHLF